MEDKMKETERVFFFEPIFGERVRPPEMATILRQQSWIGVHGFTPDLDASALLSSVGFLEIQNNQWPKPRVLQI